MDRSLSLRFCIGLLHVVVLITASSSKEVIEIQTETKADIFSTNYPESYLPREDKEWQITQEYGRWLITLQDVHIENSPGCTKDYLEIRENNTRPKRFCGRYVKQVIISTSPKVIVYFHSDETEERAGFRLTVKRVLDEDDNKRKSHEEAANAHVHKNEEIYESWFFKVLNGQVIQQWPRIRSDSTSYGRQDSSSSTASLTATKAHLQKNEGIYESWLFKVLLGSLGCVMLVFTVLITFLCLEMRKKRHERRPKQQYLKGQVIQQWPKIRSDSKSYGRQDSSSSTTLLTANGRY